LLGGSGGDAFRIGSGMASPSRAQPPAASGGIRSGPDHGGSSSTSPPAASSSRGSGPDHGGSSSPNHDSSGNLTRSSSSSSSGGRSNSINIGNSSRGNSTAAATILSASGAPAKGKSVNKVAPAKAAPALHNGTPSEKKPLACRLRRLRMPGEERLRNVFKEFSEKEQQWFNTTSLASVAPAGTKAVIVIDSPATMSGKYALARELHRSTWMLRSGVCAPRRHQEPNCVVFPIFPMNAGGDIRKPCSLSMSELKAAEAAAEADNKVTPEISETFLLKWEEPYIQPWWTPRPISHDEPRHLLMFKTALVRYPWMTHFVKQDLDAYPFMVWVLPEVARPPKGHAAKTGHVYLGQWKKTGAWPGKRKENYTGKHRLYGDCKVPAGNGGNQAEPCGHWGGNRNKDWKGNIYAVDFSAVNDAWCNDWSMTDYEKGCWKPWKKDNGLCSGFMYGHCWSFSRSLTQAIVDSRDKYIDSMRSEDMGHSDIRVSAWVNRIALKQNQSVELRAVCGLAPWRHFG